MSPDSAHVYAAGGSLFAFRHEDVECPPTPAARCRTPTAAGQSSLTLQRKTGGKGYVNWKWRRGQATAPGDFGDPETADYKFCLYDGSAGPPAMTQVVPLESLCHQRAVKGFVTQACWGPLGDGFKLKDTLTRDGIASILLLPGEDGRASLTVRGTGPRLRVPVMPLTPPVLVQLRNDDGVCWEATFGSPQINTTGLFKAKSD